MCRLSVQLLFFHALEKKERKQSVPGGVSHTHPLWVLPPLRLEIDDLTPRGRDAANWCTEFLSFNLWIHLENPRTFSQ